MPATAGIYKECEILMHNMYVSLNHLLNFPKVVGSIAMLSQLSSGTRTVRDNIDPQPRSRVYSDEDDDTAVETDVADSDQSEVSEDLNLYNHGQEERFPI